MNSMMPETTRRPLAWFKVVPQVRTDLGSESDLKNLGESLRERQLSPVGAMTDGELIYGFRRLEAARLAGLPDLAVSIYLNPLSKAEVKVIQLTDNIHRLDMSPFEKFTACEELRKLNPKWTVKELAKHLKLDPASVTRWLSPSKCIPAWQEALRAGVVRLTDCYAASQVSEQHQQEMLEMKLSGASRDALSRAAQRTNRKCERETVLASRMAIPRGMGSTVVRSAKSVPLTRQHEDSRQGWVPERGGVILEGDVKKMPRCVRLVNSVHKAIFGPTGTGKGTSFIVPWLLNQDEAAVVLDFKGENAALTARHRERMFKHVCILLDPFHVLRGQPDSFNPIDYVDKSSSSAIDDCRDLAEQIVIRTGDEKEQFWNDSVEAWIAAVIVAAVQYSNGNNRSLQTAREVLSNPEQILRPLELLCEVIGIFARLGNGKVHFILDEATSLGHLECRDDAIDKYRGYCVRLQFYCQSPSQFGERFSREQTVFANMRELFFGGDNVLAECIGNRLGDTFSFVGSGTTLAPHWAGFAQSKMPRRISKKRRKHMLPWSQYMGSSLLPGRAGLL